MNRTRRLAASLLTAIAIFAGGAAVGSPAQAATYPCTVNQTLRSGQVNSCVSALQIYLNGYINARLAQDGSFGPATKAAVKTYQSRLGIGVDGIVGPQTRLTIAGHIGIPVNSGATMAQIEAAGAIVVPMCRGWGFVFN